MQGKKFKDKGQNQSIGAGVPEIELNFSDHEGHAGKPDKYPPSWPKHPNDGAGDKFVTSVKGLFNTQRRKAKAFVLKTMRGEEENEMQGDWSENDVEISPFARQLTIIKAKKLIKRHTKKFPSKEQKGFFQCLYMLLFFAYLTDSMLLLFGYLTYFQLLLLLSN